MNIQRIITIFRRDFRDAVRDARVLLAIVVPFGVGIFYNLAFDDATVEQVTELVYVSADGTALPETLQAISEGAVDVVVREVDDPAALRDEVDDEDADVGIIIPAGFDAAVASGKRPELTVLLPESPGVESDYLVAAVTSAVRELAGQTEPVALQVEMAGTTTGESVIERIELRKYFVLVSVIMMIAMITMYAVPYVLAEEAEQRTLDALVMIASYAEVVSAKALFGLSYVTLSVALLLAITRLEPNDPVALGAGLFLLSVTLTGLGLLLGSVLKASQLTSWGGVILLPVIAPAFAVGIPAPEALRIVSLALPTSHGARLAIAAVSDEQLFSNLWLSVLVIALWGVAAYALLLWTLRRREA